MYVHEEDTDLVKEIMKGQRDCLKYRGNRDKKFSSDEDEFLPFCGRDLWLFKA